MRTTATLDAILKAQYPEVLDIEEKDLDPSIWVQFIRAQVSVKLEHPLPYGYWAEEEEKATWVNYKFEKLPSAFCYDCGRIGHNNHACDFKDELVPNRYGDHTRAGVNSPPAPTPKRTDRRQSRERDAAPPRPQLEQSLTDETVAVDPFWGHMQGSLTRERNGRPHNLRTRREGEGDGSTSRPGKRRRRPGFCTHLFADFNAAVATAELGQGQSGPSQALVFCNMSPWSPRQHTKKRKKGSGLIIREAQPGIKDMETDNFNTADESGSHYISPYIPMEPINQSCWRNYYGIEHGETSGYHGANEDGVVETRKPPEEK
ncbi:hypothetical protein LINGRAHAP2_LOCUS11795 [Linum grandiflorum]